jgi:hypothetical protein
MRLLRAVCFAALATISVSTIAPATSNAAVSIGVSVTIAPPALPVYAQPPIPGDGYMWVPGYWAYGPHGYYWVPGTWVMPPEPEMLWTPAYWGWENNVYVFHAGYWGPHVGFYGGINYGYGYNGHGFYGGRWDHGVFAYNRSVTNIRTNVHVKSVYSQTVVRVTESRVSYSGGEHGAKFEPTKRQETFSHETHTPPTDIQAHPQQAAGNGHSFLASANHGHPPIPATAHPGQFNRPVSHAAPAHNPPPQHPQGGPPQQHQEEHHEDRHDDHH